MNDSLVLPAIVAVAFAFCLGGWVGENSTDEYQNGFCTARGGTVISADYCDVEGKVVKIER